MSDDDFDPDEHCHCSPTAGSKDWTIWTRPHFSSHGEEWDDCPACAAERRAAPSASSRPSAPLKPPT